MWHVVRGLVRNVKGVETVKVRALVEEDGSLWTNLANVLQTCMMSPREDKEMAVKRVGQVWEGEVEMEEGSEGAEL